MDLKMEEEALFDRRLHPRIKAQLPAILVLRHKEIPGDITDITSQGAAVRIPFGVLKIGDIVAVRFLIQKGDAIVNAKGVISSLQSPDDQMCEVGVRFIQISLDSRNLLSSWLADRLKDRNSIDDRRTKS